VSSQYGREGGGGGGGRRARPMLRPTNGPSAHRRRRAVRRSEARACSQVADGARRVRALDALKALAGDAGLATAVAGLERVPAAALALLRGPPRGAATSLETDHALTFLKAAPSPWSHSYSLPRPTSQSALPCPALPCPRAQQLIARGGRGQVVTQAPAAAARLALGAHAAADLAAAVAGAPPAARAKAAAAVRNLAVHEVFRPPSDLFPWSHSHPPLPALGSIRLEPFSSSSARPGCAVALGATIV